MRCHHGHLPVLFLLILGVYGVDYDSGSRYTDLTNIGSSMNFRRPSSLLSVPRYDWNYQSPSVPSYIPEATNNLQFTVPTNMFNPSSNNNYFAQMAQDVMNRVIKTVAGSYSDDNLFPLYEHSQQSASSPERVQPSTTQTPERKVAADVVRSVKITPIRTTERPEDSYFVRGLKKHSRARKIFANIEAYANPQVPIEDIIEEEARLYSRLSKLRKPEIRYSPRKKYTFKHVKHVEPDEDYEQVFPTTVTPVPAPSLFERRAVEYFIGHSIPPQLVIDSLPERVSTTPMPLLEMRARRVGSDDHPVRILPRRRSKHSKARQTWMRRIHRVLDSYKQHRKSKKTSKHRRTVLPMRYE